MTEIRRSMRPLSHIGMVSKMSCYECGSNKLEIKESYTGLAFICCEQCNWLEIYDLYKADNEPDNRDD